MNFSQLKKTRGTGGIDQLRQQFDSEKSGGYEKKEGYWKLGVDKTGTGYAVIRFMPAPPDEDYPYVKMYHHGFKNPTTGKWYIENSRTTINDKDPVAELNSDLWNNGGEQGKDRARAQKRKLTYTANILVIHDPSNPENDGKVFRYEFGKRIFDMLESALKPEFEDETPINPFCLWSGANFKLKARTVDKQRSYDKSEFEDPSAVFDGDDEQLEKLWNSLRGLQEITAADKFKSYDELKRRLDLVLGTGGEGVRRETLSIDRETSSEPVARREAPAETQTTVDDDDDEEALRRYRELAAEDE